MLDSTGSLTLLAGNKENTSLATITSMHLHYFFPQ